MRKRGFTLIELMIVIAIIAIIAAIAIPGILSATRAANERNASGSLKQINSIEVTFKTSDSEGNTINDFWVLDVAGLYRIASGGVATNEGIKLIELAVAQADAAPKTAPTGVTYSTATPVSTFSPKAGYWFAAMVDYEMAGGGTTNYDPGGTYAGRNSDRFGFAAAPNSHGSSGRLVFIVNEGGTMYKKDPGSQTACWSTSPTAGSSPGGVLAGGVDTFPLDPAAGGWGKMD